MMITAIINGNKNLVKKLVTVKAGKYQQDTFETYKSDDEIYKQAKRNHVKVIAIESI